MLKLDNPQGFVQTPDGKGGLRTETAFFDIRVGVRESARPEGGLETWVDLESRPAAEVAPISVDENGQPTVILMRKQHRADQPPLYKVPGGYILDEVEGFSLLDKIAADTGIHLYRATIYYLGSMAGHPEIVTPIGLFVATEGWSQVASPREGIELVPMPLEWALDFFDRHSLGDTYGVSGLPHLVDKSIDAVGRVTDVKVKSGSYRVNSTGFELLARFERRLRSGEIQIPGYTTPTGDRRENSHEA